MWSQSTNVTDGRTDGRTNGRHAIPRPRICTKVHCAVKRNTKYVETFHFPHSSFPAWFHRAKPTVAPLVFLIPYEVRNAKNEIRTVLPYFVFLCARGIRKTVQDVVFRFSHSVLNVTHERQYSRKFVFRTPCFCFRIDDIRRKCDIHFVFRFSRSTEMWKTVRKTVRRFSYSIRKTKNGRFSFFGFRTTWEKRINGTYTDPKTGYPPIKYPTGTWVQNYPKVRALCMQIHGYLLSLISCNMIPVEFWVCVEVKWITIVVGIVPLAWGGAYRGFVERRASMAFLLQKFHTEHSSYAFLPNYISE